MLGDPMVISVSDRDQFPGFLHKLRMAPLVPNQHRDASALRDVQQFQSLDVDVESIRTLRVGTRLYNYI